MYIVFIVDGHFDIRIRVTIINIGGYLKIKRKKIILLVYNNIAFNASDKESS
jgi:hypothetical protein